MTAPRTIDGAALRRALPMAAAIGALRAALRDGTDPESDPPRTVVPVEHGQLLLMPAHRRRYAGVKIATVAPANPAAGLPRVQGRYLLFDAPTLSPLALLDGIELTTVRTAAVSALAVDLLAGPEAGHLVLFGTGPQARGHLDALRVVRPLTRVTSWDARPRMSSGSPKPPAGTPGSPSHPVIRPPSRPPISSPAAPPRGPRSSTAPCSPRTPP